MTPAECRPSLGGAGARQGAEPWLCGFGLRLQARDSHAWSGSLASGAPAPSAAVVPHGGGTHGSERGCATPVPRPPVSCCGWGDCGLGSVGVSRAAQHPAVRCRPLALARGSEHGALQPGRRSCFRPGPEAAETWPGSWPPGATAGRHKAGVQAAKGHRLPGPPAPTGPTEKLRNATPRRPPREAASRCPATWTIGFVVTRGPLSPHESWRLARVSWGRRKPWSDRVSVRFESSAGLTLGTEDSQSEGLRDRPLSAHLQPGLASGRTSFLSQTPRRCPSGLVGGDAVLKSHPSSQGPVPVPSLP